MKGVWQGWGVGELVSIFVGFDTLLLLSLLSHIARILCTMPISILIVLTRHHLHRYFTRAKAALAAGTGRELFCPFGKDCFYAHVKDDGTLHVFKDGADVCLKVRLV